MDIQPHYVIDNRIICYLCNKGYFLREPVRVLKPLSISEVIIPRIKDNTIAMKIKNTYIF